MKITHLETFILHVPVTGSRIADSVHQVTHWGAPGVVIHTDEGLRGYGYTGTLGHLPTDRLLRDCIGEAFGPLVVGEDPLEVRHLWQGLDEAFGIRWVGRAGITQMALAHRLPVVPHAADMMQIHQHLAIAHQASSLFEYIPWLRDCFEEPATVEDGCFKTPQAPGAGTHRNPDRPMPSGTCNAGALPLYCGRWCRSACDNQEL